MQPAAEKRNPPQLAAALEVLREQVGRGYAEAIATAIGVDAGTISRWVRGTITPKGDRRAALIAWALEAAPTETPIGAAYDAGYWRGVVEMAEGSARDLADRLRRTLEAAPPRPAPTPAESSAAVPPPPAPRPQAAEV